jgi:hypothetical protein
VPIISRFAVETMEFFSFGTMISIAVFINRMWITTFRFRGYLQICRRRRLNYLETCRILSRNNVGFNHVACRMTLRIYADFNSGGSPGAGPCWCLRYGDPMRHLDEVADELGLSEGMPVTLFYEDDSEEFEVSATLEKREASVANKWVAHPDWTTMHRIRG